MSSTSQRSRRDLLEAAQPRSRALGDPIVRSWRLALGSVALPVVAAFAVRDRGGLLALGPLTGVLRRAASRCCSGMLRPVGALLAAARPLGIAVLLILAAGTTD